MFFTDKLKKFRTQDVFEINNNLQLNDTNAKEVEVTFEFYRIGHINSTSGKFEASLIVQAKWFVDSRLEENSDIFDYNADKHWNPKLYIENEIATNNETVYRVEEVSDSLVCVKEYKILEGTFWCLFEFKHFPVDVQELSIIVASQMGYNEVCLIQDNRKLSFIDIETCINYEGHTSW